MIKVQKPTPKTFDKLDKNKHSIKKKKVIKLKHGTAAVSSEASSSKAIEKVKLIKGMVKADKVLTPLKEKEKPFEKKIKEKKSTTGAPAIVDNPLKKNKREKKSAVHQKRAEVLSPLLLPALSSNSLKKKSKSKEEQSATNEKSKQKSKVVEEETVQNLDSSTKKQQKLATNKVQKKKSIIKNKKQQQKTDKKTKEKKSSAVADKIFEPVPFDEEKFNAIVSVENVKKIATALKEQVEQEVTKKKNSIFSDYRYLLNVVSFKIPNCPKRMVKLNLKHSLVDKNDDVVIIVTDLNRGAKADYEPTIEHYEELFRQAGIEGLKIMPFNQLKKECHSFESVRKFANTYDYFLCDARIVSHVVGFCGKILQKPRTTLHSVRLNNPEHFKSEIEKSLRRTAFKQLMKGNLISIPVGSHKYTMQQLAENVDCVVKQLKTIYPGGLGNVRSMNLKVDIVGTSPLPIYVSMGQAPLNTPYVVGPREARMLKLKREANEVLTKFALTKEGSILKLSKGQIEKKRKIKEVKDALLTKHEEGAMDEDGEDSGVPTKRSRREEKEEDTNELKKKNSDDHVEPEDDGGEDPGDDSGEDDADDDSDSEDIEDDIDDDDDEDEENADVEEGGDGDDDDNEDDDDDEDGDDDDDQDDDDSDD